MDICNSLYRKYEEKTFTFTFDEAKDIYTAKCKVSYFLFYMTFRGQTCHSTKTSLIGSMITETVRHNSPVFTLIYSEMYK